jgi:hypothetical protein
MRRANPWRPIWSRWQSWPRAIRDSSRASGRPPAPRTAAWPGAVFEGGGTIQAIIDERADERQRKALATIVYGGETEPAKTHWWVYHAMWSTVHSPIFARIEFEADIEKRRARVAIPGVLTSVGQPIVSPVTGAEHRVRIDIPNGIEFEQAEIGSASTKGAAKSSST